MDKIKMIVRPGCYKLCKKAHYLAVLLSVCVLISPFLPTRFAEVLAVDYSTNFEHLSIEDGLSQSVVFSIVQDMDGYIWFATKDGLNKYDGVEFTVYRKIPGDNSSISGDYINTAYVDSSGVLWAGTLNNGLNRFNNIDSTFTSFENDSEDSKSISHNYISAICEGSEGILWVGTHNGLNKFDLKTLEFERYYNDPYSSQSIISSTIWSVFVDIDGIVWIGTDDGLTSFDPVAERFKHYAYDANDPQSISSNVVRSIFQTKDGVLWFGTYNGLNKFNKNTETFERYLNDPEDTQSISNNRIRSICEDDTGNLWIATTDGLNKMDVESGVFTRYMHDAGNSQSISNDVVWSLLYDTSGILWVGTFNGGANKLVMSKQAFTNYRHNPGDPQSISNSIVKAIYEAEDGNMWIGTLDGLNKFDPVEEVFTRYKHDPLDQNTITHNSVKAIIQTEDGMLWIGTTDGLDRLDPAKEVFTHFKYSANNPNSLGNDIIWSFCEGEDNTLWIGTYDGFDRLDMLTLNFQRYYFEDKSLSNVIVYDIYEQGESLWIATSNGLGHLDRETDVFSGYTNDQDKSYSISDDNVKCIFEDSLGELWFGTGGGLNKFNQSTGDFNSYTTEDGLANNTVYGILQDDEGRLWLSTNNGLSVFDIERETFRNFNISDGLQSKEFSEGAYLKSKDGRLFFGGINGLNAFYPSEVEGNNYIAPVVITDFSLRGSEISFDKPLAQVSEITLKYEQNSFSIEFAALDYTSPYSNLYSYRLMGFDDEWRYCTAENRIATYTNLSDGEYEFFVSYSRNASFENPPGLDLKITILAPFWKQAWFIMLMVVVFVAVIHGILRFRTRTITKQKQRLERQVAKRTIQLKDEIEKHKKTERKLQVEIDKRVGFTRALVHELKTPLTTLSISCDLFTEEAQEEPYKSLARSINRGLSSLSKRIDEMLDLARGEIGLLKLKPKITDLNIFMQDIKRDLTTIANSKGVELESTIGKGLPEAEIDAERISQVIYNLVDNALKFTHDKGIIKLIAEAKEGMLTVKVRDYGRGISHRRQKLVFSPSLDSKDSERFGGLGIGLVLSKMLVELHGGTIWVESKFRFGSVFIFSIPLHQNNSQKQK